MTYLLDAMLAFWLNGIFALAVYGAYRLDLFFLRLGDRTAIRRRGYFVWGRGL